MDSKASPADPCILVIFGATGDLTKRLLIPALCNLRRAGLLPDKFAVVGVARGASDDESFRDNVRPKLAANADWKWLSERMFYFQGAFDDSATYAKLTKFLAGIDAKQDTRGNYLFYLATPPKVF